MEPNSELEMNGIPKDLPTFSLKKRLSWMQSNEQLVQHVISEVILKEGPIQRDLFDSIMGLVRKLEKYVV